MLLNVKGNIQYLIFFVHTIKRDIYLNKRQSAEKKLTKQNKLPNL